MRRWRDALRATRGLAVRVKGSAGAPFGEHAARVWTVIAGAAAVLALVISVVQLRGSPEPEQPPPVPETALSVVDLAVQRPSEVDADRSADGEPTEKIKLDTVVVDVSVKNAGRTTAHIDKAAFRFRFARSLEYCGGGTGGPSNISANYSVKVPRTDGDDPFTVERRMRFEIAPGDVERLTFTVGPEHVNGEVADAWLYVADLALHHDGAGSPLDAGTVALVGPSGDGLANLDAASADRLPCVEENRKLVEALFALPAVRAEELAVLRRRYANVRPPQGPPAERSCADQAPAAVGMLCGWYSFGSVTVSARFAEPPPANSELVVRLRPRGGGAVRVLFARLGVFDALQPGSRPVRHWQVGCTAAQRAAARADACAGGTAHGEEATVDIAVEMPVDSPPELEVAVELRRASGAAGGTGAAPVGGPLLVRQGR